MRQSEEMHADSTGDTKGMTMTIALQQRFFAQASVVQLHSIAQHLHHVQQDTAKHLIECLQTERLMQTRTYKYNES